MKKQKLAKEDFITEFEKWWASVNSYPEDEFAREFPAKEIALRASYYFFKNFNRCKSSKLSFVECRTVETIIYNLLAELIDDGKWKTSEYGRGTANGLIFALSACGNNTYEPFEELDATDEKENEIKTIEDIRTAGAEVLRTLEALKVLCFKKDKPSIKIPDAYFSHLHMKK